MTTRRTASGVWSTSPRKRTSPWRPSSARATEIFILEVSRPTKTALSCCMARPRCVRLGTGLSGATPARRIPRAEPPPLQQQTYGLPDVLVGVQLRRLSRKRHEGDVGGDHKFLGLMPARLIHQDKGMRPGCDRLRNLLQVQGHALRRAAGQNQARAFALSRTDGPEDVGRGGPLVLGGGRARAAFGPASRDLVLLPDPGLIGEPDLDHLAMSLGFCDLLQTGGEVFLKAETAASFFA